jgi:hypothetical protein
LFPSQDFGRYLRRNPPSHCNQEGDCEHWDCTVHEFSLTNDERMHHYQRGRTSITGLMVELRKIIETGRLVVVVMTRLVLLLDSCD